MSNDINIEEHIGLIYYIAQELSNTEDICIRAFGRDVREYLGEGFIALQIAQKNFKPELGWKFSTYASGVIRDRLIQAARQSSLIKIGRQARYQATRFMKGQDAGLQRKVKDALKVMCSKVVPITRFTEKCKNDDLPSWEVIEELYARLNELDEKTRSVLVMRYGLDGNDVLTLEEVGQQLDPPVTRERIRQIEKKGIEKLKEGINL